MRTRAQYVYFEVPVGIVTAARLRGLLEDHDTPYRFVSDVVVGQTNALLKIKIPPDEETIDLPDWAPPPSIKLTAQQARDLYQPNADGDYVYDN